MPRMGYTRPRSNVKLLPLKPYALAGLLTLAASGSATVSYTLTPDPTSRTYLVKMELSDAGARETFRMPAWSPGFYFLIDYAKKVSSVAATAPDGTALELKRDGKAWTVANPARTPVRLTYRVLADDKGLGFFGAYLKGNVGFWNGPALWMSADGRKDEPVRLRVRVPEGWDVATAMNPEGSDPKTFGKENFTANGYDELLDHPFQIGSFVRKSYEIDGHPYQVVWTAGESPIKADLDAETERLRKGYVPALKLFGGASFPRYLTIVHLAVGDFSGGLEHRASNVQAIPNLEVLHLDDLAVHEYIHAWNVKQIRPKVLGPFDYTGVVRTGNLWFSEGVTDYYAKMETMQAGLKDRAWTLDQIQNALQETAASEQAKKINLEQCSQRAWENGGFGVGDFSYYTKGLLAGWVFDGALRTRTAGKTSLDDVMRALYARHALPKAGFEEGELRDVLVEFGGPEMGPLYDAVVRGTGQVPTEWATGIGLRVLLPGVPFGSPRYQTDAEGLVTAVASADDAVRVGDRVVSLRRDPTSTPDAPRALARVRRGDRELELPAPLLVTSVPEIRLGEDPFATSEAKARREAWYLGPMPRN